MNSTAALPRARKDGLVIKELASETLVYDLERDEAHCLNQTAGMVWQLCDGRTTVTKMASLLSEQLDTHINEDVVWLAMKQLQRFHLIESYDRVAVGTPLVSRRNLVLKYAPAALALPLILSISAPTAAQASTNPACAVPPFPLGCPCGNDVDCQSANCNAGVCGPVLKVNPEGGARP
jgi:hypothetical protein